MTPQDFCYWLQGLLEVGKPQSLDATQIAQIQDHLNLVFKKETPFRGPPSKIKTIFDEIDIKKLIREADQRQKDEDRHRPTRITFSDISHVKFC